MLFLLPVGGGIPAGALLAQAKGLPWPATALLYLVSDLVLALAFEPILRLLVILGCRVAFMARLGAAMARGASPCLGRGTGPLAQVLVSFLVDPMTGRASALAAGFGPVGGWACAIAGDMLYFAVVAVATLRLCAWLHNPQLVLALVMGAMVAVPMVLRRVFGQGRGARDIRTA